MPLPPAPAATLGVGAAANGMGPWVSIDAARAARALHERRHERKRGPSVAELTLRQHASAATQVHIVAHEWRASRARYSKRAGEDEEAVDTGLMVPAGSGRDRAEVGRHDLDAAWRSV